MNREETVLVKCDWIGEVSKSGMAQQVSVGRVPTWVPVSVLHEINRGKDPSIRVDTWFAEKKEW